MGRLQIYITDEVAEQIRQFSFKINDTRVNWIPKAILAYIEAQEKKNG